MTAREVLDELQRRNVTVTVREGGGLNLEPRAVVDAELEAKIREHKDELVALVTAVPSGPGRSQAQRLAEIAEAAEVFRAPDGDTGFASLKINGHRETWPVRSRGFRLWLVSRFYATEKRPPAAQALADALSVVEARARFAGPVDRVHLRFAAHDGAIYLDLVNERWEAVEITARGWNLVSDPPVRFRRARGMLPLPRPERGGSFKGLRDFVNAKDEPQWCLLAAWLIAAARPTGPYPVLVLGGEHGAAKSTTAEVLRRLIDPSSAVRRGGPGDARDLMITATNGWVIALDNLSVLPSWLSDALCRLSTGGGLATRELYTDAEEVIFEAQRPVILNGIEEIVTRADLLDRSILLDLPVIDETRRRPETAFWRDFDTERAGLLGALLDAVSTALAREQSIKPDRLPRMADFALWVTAAAPAFGWTDDHFLAIYDANRADAHEVALDASAVAGAVRTLAEQRDKWSGTATDLLVELGALVDERTRYARGWPRNARALGGALRRLAPSLRTVGVSVEFDREPGGQRRRLVVIKKPRASDRPNRPDRPDRSENAGFARDGAPPPGTVERPAGADASRALSAREIARRDGRDGRDDQEPALSVELAVPEDEVEL